MESLNPTTGERVGAVTATAARDVATLVAQAREVSPLWARLRPVDRARYMARAAQAVIDEFDELAELLCAEQGRPRAEAGVMELLAAVETLQWLAEHGPGILAGERIPFSRTQHPVKRGRWTYEPLGVVGVLGPAAEPFATPLGDVAVALMAGNGVVLKPSPHVPLLGARIARIFARAGLPEGLLGVAQGHTDVGAALVAADVAQVRFTGGARAGREVGAACARGLKRSVLELGGRDAMLVLADARIDRAARGAVWAAFANAGQCGGSVRRAFCVAGVHDRFLAGVLHHASELRVGDPRDPRTSVGPLVTAGRADHVAELVADAVAQGATLHRGGRVSGALVAPIVLTGVLPEMRIAREEVPGPVLCVEAVPDAEAAVTAANAGGLGLGASVWTADRVGGERVARELNAGMVWCNDHLVDRSAPQAPWGGVGGVGIGRARGAIALRTCAEPKVVTWDPPIGRPAWWFPYDSAVVTAARTYAGLRSKRDADKERALRTGTKSVATVFARWLRALRG